MNTVCENQQNNVGVDIRKAIVFLAICDGTKKETVSKPGLLEGATDRASFKWSMNMSLLESLYPNQQFWCSIPKQPVWGVLFKTQTSKKKSRSEPTFRFDQVPSTAHDV